MDIELGTTPSGIPVPLSLEELLATRLLVQGNSGSGKSHLLRRLLEQSAQAVQQVVIDPEGDFASLSQVFGHIVVDAGAQSENGMKLIARRARQTRVSVVVNLEHLDAERQMRHAGAFLNGLFDTDRQYWFPALVVVDEAQLFAPAAAGEVADDARKASLEAMTNLMCRGRKRGLAGVIATQRLAKLAKNVAAEASNFLMGRTFLDIDMQRAADLLGIDRRQAEVFRDLNRGYFVGLGPALSRRSITVRIGEVRTRSHAGGSGLVPLPEMTPEEAHGLLFKSTAPPPPAYVEESGPDTDSLLAAMGRSEPPPPAIETAPAAEATTDEREDEPDCSAPVAEPKPAPAPETPPAQGIEAVLEELFGEAGTLGRSASALYDDFLARCRARRLPGRVLDLTHFRRRMILAQAGITADIAARPGWDKAAAVANGLEEQFQGIFLHLASAALRNAPCPSDSMITQAFGSHSPRRALAALARMQQDGVVEIYEELDGSRVIVLPALQWRTAPGHPEDLPAWAG